MKTNIWKLKRFWMLLCFPVGILLLIFAACTNGTFAEWFALTIYPVLSLCGNFLSGLLPFSLAELLVVLSFPAFLFYLLWYLVKLVRRKDQRKKNAVRFAGNFLCAAAVIFLLFVLNCGINYYRQTFAQTCGLPVQESSAEELKKLSAGLAAQTINLRSQLQEDQTGVMNWQFSGMPQAGKEAKNAFDHLNGDYPLLRPGYGSPKAVLLSRGMSWMNITGIFFPFTMEANVNADAPKYSIPVTMCHELSHLRGFMREDEANFIGYLACKKSESKDFQYSGYMLAFTYANNALYGVDAAAAQMTYNSLSDGVKRDFAYSNAYWKQFEGPVAEVANNVNNAYLQSNNQQDGVKSYGRMVDLLLAEQRASN